MKIYIVQAYVEVRAYFPFSHLWQRFLSEQLSAIAHPSDKFTTKYGADYSLGIYISARTGIRTNEIKGPTIFRKARDIEYTLFLPYDVIASSKTGCHDAMSFILGGIEDIFAMANISAEGLSIKKNQIIERVCTDVSMLEEQWPT